MNRDIEKIKVKKSFIAQSDPFVSAVGEKHQPRRENLGWLSIENYAGSIIYLRVSCYTMNFIYFIDLDDPLVCLNFINTNSITCASVAHPTAFGNTEYSLYAIDPDKLLTDINSLQIGFISPRLQFLILSNWHRNGLRIGMGMTDTKWFNKTQIDRIHKVAKLEVEFEKVRRKIGHLLPSRLACIFLAEDNFEGRIMLQNMFSHKTHFHLASVEISFCKKLHKVDSKWISKYESDKKTSTIESYWNGHSLDNNPQFEYLLEGQITLINSSDRDLIKEQYNISKYSS